MPTTIFFRKAAEQLFGSSVLVPHVATQRYGQSLARTRTLPRYIANNRVLLSIDCQRTNTNNEKSPIPARCPQHQSLGQR